MAKKKTTDTTEQLLNTIVEALQDKKGQEITTIDLRGIESTICDYFVICEAESTTQVNALADNVQRLTYINLETEPRKIEGRANSIWILLDYFDIVVHVFQREYRQFYKIDDLWSDGVVNRIVEPVMVPATVKEGSKIAIARAKKIEARIRRQAEQIENAEKISDQERDMMTEALLVELKGTHTTPKPAPKRPYVKKASNKSKTDSAIKSKSIVKKATSTKATAKPAKAKRPSKSVKKVN